MQEASAFYNAQFMQVLTAAMLIFVRRCPLIFPNLGDSVVVLRTGCLMHLDKYSQLPDEATAPMPPAGPELKTVEEKVKALAPVSKFKVIGAAYCKYPYPEPEEPPPAEDEHEKGKKEGGTGEEDEEEDEEEEDENREEEEDDEGEEAGGVAAAAGGAGRGRGGRGGWRGRGGRGGGSKKKPPPHRRRTTPPLLAHQAFLKQQEEEVAAAAGAAEHDAVKGQGLTEEKAAYGVDTPGEAVAMEMKGPGSADQKAAAVLSGFQGPAAMEVDGEGRAQMKPEASGAEATAAAAPGTQAVTGVDGVEGIPGATAAAPAKAPQAPAPPAIPTYRPACMWVLLSPVNGSSDTAGPVALPLHIDPTLPDYIVQAPNYESRMQKGWQPGDRFRMYFGGKLGTKVGGAYYKGYIKKVHADIKEGDNQPDPWESIEVLWDSEDGSSQHRVSTRCHCMCRVRDAQGCV